jgi:hypothetical protein
VHCCDVRSKPSTAGASLESHTAVTPVPSHAPLWRVYHLPAVPTERSTRAAPASSVWWPPPCRPGPPAAGAPRLLALLPSTAEHICSSPPDTSRHHPRPEPLAAHVPSKRSGPAQPRSAQVKLPAKPSSIFIRYLTPSLQAASAWRCPSTPLRPPGAVLPRRHPPSFHAAQARNVRPRRPSTSHAMPAPPL